MSNQIKDLFNSLITVVSMFALSCCMVVNAFQMCLYDAWTPLAVASSLIGGIILLVWLIWATIMLAFRKQFSSMPDRYRKWLDGCSGILFIVWIVLLACH